MTQAEIIERKSEYFNTWHYSMRQWKAFDYTVLQKMAYVTRPGRDRLTYSDVIIMFDTETSKKDKDTKHFVTEVKSGIKHPANHICAWTISLRAFNKNIVTLYGSDPWSAVQCMTKISENLPGEFVQFYAHNMAYDWVFLERFMIREWGEPIGQLNVKPHYPINIKFSNGIILRDSLILFQRSLDKVAQDFDVEHKKAVGKWDYDRIRHQRGARFSDDEKEYIEHDTLAGVEALDKLRLSLNKKVYNMPYTATGIPREEVRIRAGKQAHQEYIKLKPTFEVYQILEQVYHGGFTHGNRHLINQILTGVRCYDFASSYPFVMLSEKYPMERFTPHTNCAPELILKGQSTYAWAFLFIATDIKIKRYDDGMPALQYSKCVDVINPILDNGRILQAEYVEIWLTEQDLAVIYEHYNYKSAICTNVYQSRKDYLPGWFTDYVFECFEKKTQLKGGDKVAYALAKSRLNSLYGMCVQKCIQEIIEEDYESGEFAKHENQDLKELYEEYTNRRSVVLPYQWGVWVTAYAFRNLFELGKCIDYENGGSWIYSDTDSIYSDKWDETKVQAYNERCKRKLQANGYGCVNFKGREWWLGVAESAGDEDLYTEFKVQGAKRYAGRQKADGELHITVAGVPKKGVCELENDLNKFEKGLVFRGSRTGKKAHTYIYEEIYKDENGDWTGNSIDLSPCDYLLDAVERYDWDMIFEDEIGVQYYDEEEV